MRASVLVAIVVLSGCLGPTDGHPQPSGTTTGGSSHPAVGSDDVEVDNATQDDVPSVTYEVDDRTYVAISFETPGRALLVLEEAVEMTQLSVSSEGGVGVILRADGPPDPDAACSTLPEEHDFWVFNQSGSDGSILELSPGTYVLDAGAAKGDQAVPVDVTMRFGHGEANPGYAIVAPRTNRSAVQVFGMGELSGPAEFNLTLRVPSPSWVFGWFWATTAASAGTYERSTELRHDGNPCISNQETGPITEVAGGGFGPTPARAATQVSPAGAYTWSGSFTATHNVPAQYNAVAIAFSER